MSCLDNKVCCSEHLCIDLMFLPNFNQTYCNVDSHGIICYLFGGCKGYHGSGPASVTCTNIAICKSASVCIPAHTGAVTMFLPTDTDPVHFLPFLLTYSQAKHSISPDLWMTEMKVVKNAFIQTTLKTAKSFLYAFYELVNLYACNSTPMASCCNI